MKLLRMMVFLVVAASFALGAEEPKPPRYRLPVGREFTYTGGSLYIHKEGRFTETQIWTVRILKKNDDGSVRMLVHNENTLSEQDTRQQPIGEATKDSSLAYFDLFDDGRSLGNPSLGVMLDPTRLFPPLPADARQASKRWSRTLPDGEVWSYASAPNDGRSPVFRASKTTPWDKAYGISWTETITFDPDALAISGIVRLDHQTYGFVGSGQERIKLAGLSNFAESRMAAMNDDAKTYFDAKTIFDDCERKSRVNADPSAIMATGTQAMTAAKAKVAEPMFRDQINFDIEAHRKRAISGHPWARELAEMIGHRLRAFTLDDLNGRKHTLEQFRGKVIVLDFWSRENGWSLKARSQIQAIIDDFADKPVVILGMNTDLDDNDAWFVVHAMDIKHPTLKAYREAPAMNITGLPALMILDQDGKVADIMVGYSRSLRENAGAVIQKLLDRK